ncbi:MAG TPA: PilZ domain-containing protein [Gammaproteobacteria bacterium]|nr:PilZ domain-containing protein [Gammaproteobacteria bacterium]
MEYSDNRRHHHRYDRHDRMFVQILSMSERGGVSDKTLCCYCCDACVDGLKVELESEIPVDSMVDLWVDFDGGDHKLYLRGHVCWCYDMAGEDEHFQLGIELEDAYATDYERWVGLLEKKSE